MRLLYLMTEPFGVGGVQSDMLALGPDLTARGHEVHLATTPGVLIDELTSKGVHFSDIDFWFNSPGSFLKAVKALRDVVREKQIDVVAPQSVRSTMIAYAALRLWPFRDRAGKKQRMPIITTIHNIHSPVHFKYGGMILNTCADYVIFESHYERNRLISSGLSEERSEVIHSGIDTERFKPIPADDALLAQYGLDKSVHKVFGIVARLSEEKGHNYLVDAFAKLHAKEPNARLLIIGDGPLMDDVKQQVEALGLSSVIIFTGMQRNVAAYLAMLDVFVLSSTRESFPLAAREAMAAGCAVIAPNIGGCPEVVADGEVGYLFTAADVDELFQKMAAMLEEERYKDFGSQARQRVERLFSRLQWVDGDERVYVDSLS